MSEHTKGELKYIGSTSIVCIETNGSRRISIATVLPAGVDIDTNCKYAVDFQANAEHLVKCCNCHDALVAVSHNLAETMGVDYAIEKLSEMKNDNMAMGASIVLGGIQQQAKAALEKVNKQ